MAERDSRAATVFVGVEAVLLGVLTVEVVRQDILREARKGARGEKSRAGHMGSAANGGCFSHERLSHARCCCSHTIFVQFALNRSSPLGGESEV